MQDDMSQTSWRLNYDGPIDVATKLLLLYYLLCGIAVLTSALQFAWLSWRKGYGVNRLQQAQKSLGHWSKVTALAVLFYFVVECAKVFDGLSYSKTVSGGLLVGSLAQILDLCSVGVFFLLIFAVECWFLRNREYHATHREERQTRS